MFVIPEDLTVLNTKALRDFALQAAAAYESIKDDVTEDTVTDDQLDEMETYSTFMLDVDAELEVRAQRAQRFATLNTEPEDLEEDGEEDETPVPVPAVFAETVEPDAPTPTLAQVTHVSPPIEDVLPPARKMFSYIAGADSGFASAAELDGWDDLVKAFNFRSRSHVRGAAFQQNNFASIRREFGDLTVLESDSDQETMRKVDLVRDERNSADGGSLLAGVGW